MSSWSGSSSSLSLVLDGRDLKFFFVKVTAKCMWYSFILKCWVHHLASLQCFMCTFYPCIVGCHTPIIDMVCIIRIRCSWQYTHGGYIALWSRGGGFHVDSHLLLFHPHPVAPSHWNLRYNLKTYHRSLEARSHSSIWIISFCCLCCVVHIPFESFFDTWFVWVI